MQLGVIADDFTGATDIASFLVRNGMPTVQLNGVPTRDLPLTSEAVVISLKTRSCPAEMAVSQSLARTLADHTGFTLRQTDHATQLFKLKYEETDGGLRLNEFTRRQGLLDKDGKWRVEIFASDRLL